MKTGIIGAMESEVAALREAMVSPSVTTVAGMKFWEGRLEDRDAVLVQCGMGKVNAGVCAQLLITRFGVDRVINTGVAGSLDRRLKIGDMVISTDAVEHDFDVSPIGYAKGEIPYTGRFAFPADETLRAQAREAVRTAAPEIGVFEGRVCSGDQFIASAEQKEAILAQFGGLCCEMEGGAIAQVCYLNRVPFVILRAISDGADGSGGMDFSAFEAEAARHCAATVQVLLRNSER